MKLLSIWAKKKGRYCANGRCVWLLPVIVVAIIIALFIIRGANDVYAFAKPDKTVTVEVKRGASVRDVAAILKEKGVIDMPALFELYSKRSGYDTKINPGTFELNSNMGYADIFSALNKPKKKESVRFTIPEGYEFRQIVDLLEEKKLINRDKFLDAAKNYDFDYWFLKGLPNTDNRLEGFLFPDTYEVFPDEGEVSIIKRMLDNFDNKYSDEFKNREKELGMTTQQVITLASIIEREAAAPQDFTKVSSVFHNRLKSTQYPYLQSCATIQYILKERKDVLSIPDTKIDNPYNTYVYKGLPPGPIASPGLTAIKAALYPDKTDYYFFVAKPDGTHIFSKTFSEHLAAIKAANSTKGTGAITK